MMEHMAGIRVFMMRYWVVFLFLFLQLITHLIWLISPQYFTYGDSGVYIPSTQLELIKNFTQIYTTSGMGGVDLGVTTKPISLLHGIFAQLGLFYPISLKLIYFIPILFIAPIGMYLFMKKVLRLSNLSIFIGMICFFFNTYILQLQTGNLLLLGGISFIWWALYFFHIAITSFSLKNIILSAISIFIISVYDFRIFYISIFIFLLYLIVHLNKISKYKQNIIKITSFICILSIVGLLNFYWILGLSKIGVLVNNTLFDRGLFGSGFFNIFYSLTLHHPFWTGYMPAIFIKQNIPLYFYIIPIIVILAIIINKVNKYIIFFGVMSLSGIFLSKQISLPFGEVYNWMFLYFPGFNAFREASKFYSLIALGYAGLIAYTIEGLKHNKYLNKNWVIFPASILIGTLFLWNSKPLINNDIGTLFIPKQIPDDYNILNSYIDKQTDEYRTLWLPTVSRWGLYTNKHRNITFNDILTFTLDQDDAKAIAENNISQPTDFLKNKEILFQDIINYASVKYVVVPLIESEDDDFYTYYRTSSTQSSLDIRNQYIDLLNTMPFLEKVDIGTQNIAIYQNKNRVSKMFADSLPSTEEKIIAFHQVSATRYQFKLNNLSNKTDVIFSENYNADWNIYQKNLKWIDILVNKSITLPENLHTKNKFNLNSFTIDPDYIKANFDKSMYKENPDGSIDVELTLYFKPQSYFYLGIIISGTTLILCLGYLGYYWVRKKKNQNTPSRQAKPTTSLNLSPVGREGNGEQKAQSTSSSVTFGDTSPKGGQVVSEAIPTVGRDRNKGQKKKRSKSKGHNTVKIKK